jgi:hypothetical protein
MEPGKSIGDMAFILVYSVLTVACFVTAWREAKRTSLRPYCWIWLAIGIVLILLCVQTANRSLNVVTQVLREQAVQQHWYQERRALQEQVVRAGTIILIPCLVLTFWALRRVLRRYLLAGSALLALIAYGGLQAISLHRIDNWMHSSHFGLLGKTWWQLLCAGLATAALTWAYYLDRGQAEAAADSLGSASAPETAEAPITNAAITCRTLYTAHGCLMAIALCASTHAFVYRIVWLAPAVLATIANILLLALVTRKSIKISLPKSVPISAFLLIPAVYLSIRTLGWRQEIHYPLSDPAWQLFIYGSTAICAALLSNAAPNLLPALVAPMGAVGAICCLEGIAFLFAHVHSLSDLKHAIPFSNGLRDNGGNRSRMLFPLGHWNLESQWLLVSLMIALGLSAVSSGRAKRAWIGVAALHMICIFLTASRWGLFCTLLVLPIFALRNYRVGRWAALVPVALVIVFCTTQALPASQGISRESHSMEYRSWRWQHAMEAARAHPWTGEGALPSYLRTNSEVPPDGQYFALLRIGGWPALLALLVALAVFGAAILRLLRSDISVPAWQILFSCALSLLGIVVGGYLETLLVGPCFLLFLSMLSGLLLGLETQLTSASVRQIPQSGPSTQPTNSSNGAQGVSWDGGTYRSTTRKG